VVRDNKGKFVKGHEGTGGRKKRVTEEKYLQLLKKTVSPDDWTEIIQRAVLDAKRGDGIARKFIADYLIGAPVQKVDAKISGDLFIDWGDNASDNDSD
jgi:hypothetical protein